MYEHKTAPLISKKKFAKRLFIHSLLSFLILLISLAFGIAGYHFTENLSFTDSLLNAAMILGGMGPVNLLHTEGGKLFASFYALYSGIVFLVVAGIIFAPVAHRILHMMHIDLK